MNIPIGIPHLMLDQEKWFNGVIGVLGAIGLVGVLFLGSGMNSRNIPLRYLGVATLGLSGSLLLLWLKMGPFRPLSIFLPLVLAGLLFHVAGRIGSSMTKLRGVSFDEQRQAIIKLVASAPDRGMKLALSGKCAERELTSNAAATASRMKAWLAMRRCAGNLMIASILAWGAAQFVAPDAANIDPKSPVLLDFWPEEVLHSENGYLTSTKFVPLRAIARRPNACLYDRADTENAGAVLGVMDTWMPYYVFANTKKSLLVAIKPNAKEDELRWVLAQDCFCWTTRECLNIEQPTTIYRTLEDARAQTNPLEIKYAYPFQNHFTPGDKTKSTRGFALASLPIFANVDGKYFGFVRPEGNAGMYEICWLPWDGSDGAVECRLRASRNEFESYIVGIRKLMIDWQNIEKKADAKKTLYASGQEHIMQVNRPQGSDVSLDTIKTRNQGIPRLDGYLQRPIESELAYEDIRKKVLKMMELSNRLDLWSNDEVTFIKLSDMP